MSKTDKTSSKEKIILAAIEEFGEKGYKHASTNNIVIRSSMSKGLIFHYFKSKNNLHMVCADRVYKEYMDKLISSKAMEERDLFKRIKAMATDEIQYMTQDMASFKFLMDVKILSDEGTMPKLTELVISKEKEFMELAIENIDDAQFITDVPTDKLFSYIYNLYVSYSYAAVNEYGKGYELVYDYLDKGGKDYHKAQVAMNELLSELDNIGKIIKYGVYKR